MLCRIAAAAAIQDVELLEGPDSNVEDLKETAQAYCEAFMPVYQRLGKSGHGDFCKTAMTQRLNHQKLGSNSSLRSDT